MKLSNVRCAIALLASTGTAYANDINDSLYDGLKGMIASEVAAQCKHGSKVMQRDGAFSLASNGNVICPPWRLQLPLGVH